MNISTNNPTVDAVGLMKFSGNIVPSAWYKTITDIKGFADQRAIAFLSDIVYWYRPLEVRNELTGEIEGYKKRFKADMMQRSYAAFAEQFNCSKRQATDTIIALEKLGVIKRVFRTIRTGQFNDIVLNNVLFIALDADRLRELTFPQEESPKNTAITSSGTPITKFRDTYPEKEYTPVTPKEQTNTEITTKITTENNLSIYRDGDTEDLKDGLMDGQSTEDEIRDLLCLESDDYDNHRMMMSSEEFENYKEIPAMLSEMINTKQARTYNGCFVSHGSKVRQKMEYAISKDEHRNLVNYGIRASKNFLNACINNPPKNPAAYFKAILWTSLSTYTLEDNAEFTGTYYG